MSEFQNVIVKIEDIRKVAFCSRGSREFFMQNGLDWSKFLQEGLPAQVFLDLNDSMAYKVVVAAKERMESENEHG